MINIYPKYYVIVSELVERTCYRCSNPRVCNICRMYDYHTDNFIETSILCKRCMYINTINIEIEYKI